ncbi:MAG: CoA pyrophosphatase [Anaerovoracaceae bacterium]
MLSLNKIKTKLRNRKVGTIDEFKYFAILIPMYQDHDGIKLLFEQRSSYMKVQPGEICFPGGKVEDGESTKEAALRETYEEIGLDNIEIIGQGDVLITGYKYMIFPYVGLISKDYKNQLKLNNDEVESVFEVPLEWFMKNKPEDHMLDIVQQPRGDFPFEKIKFEKGYNFRRGKDDVPIYIYEDKVIWGITARIIKNFIKLISL